MPWRTKRHKGGPLGISRLNSRRFLIGLCATIAALGILLGRLLRGM